VSDFEGQKDFQAASFGFVITVRGSKAGIGLPSPTTARVTVGSFVAIEVGETRLVGMITEVAERSSPDAVMDSYMTTASVDLVGEICNVDGAPRFQRGVSTYPTIGDAATLLSPDQMRLIYAVPDPRAINIGHLFHDKTIPAQIDVDSLLNRHFAILGSTGVGKSSGVAIILREMLAVRGDLRVFLLDCHNEYGRCFGEQAHVISSRDLKLPFWLFNFEEFIDVIYGGRAAVDEEIEILSELIPMAKSTYGQYRTGERLALKRTDPKSTGYTVDTPVPYLLQDLIGLIDERMGKLENRTSRMNYHRLMSRIETIRNNPRYDFMFENANVGGDTMAELLSQLFRIDAQGKPITIMQLAGLPVEVVDAVVCVLCRLAFDFGLWSDGAVPLLFVCEEAHRYASVDHSIGFGPTRRALSRIAKEGRKYGVFLGLVSQRPSELDPNIISQCATLFAMRMANDRDQALLRSAVSDSAADLLAFVPSLGTREVIGFGEGVPFPARIKFKTLPEHLLLRSDSLGASHGDLGTRSSAQFMEEVVDRWRRAVTGRKPRPEDAAGPAITAEASEPASASSRLDQARYQLLKR
jgi:DNA helicase HerA-like ATPase